MNELQNRSYTHHVVVHWIALRNPPPNCNILFYAVAATGCAIDSVSLKTKLGTFWVPRLFRFVVKLLFRYLFRLL